MQRTEQNPVIITGDRELDRQLEGLRKRDIRSAVTKGINAGMTPIVKEVRLRAPVGKTRMLKRSIGKRIMKGQPTDTMQGKIGVNVGKRTKRSRKAAPHSHLVALGTRPRYTKAGAYRGIMPQNEFVNQGFAVAESSARDRMRQKVVEVLRKYTE